MKPEKFEQQNTTFTAEGCNDLPAWRYMANSQGLQPNADGNIVIVETRWILSAAERQAIIDGGAVVLRQVGLRPQPVSVGVIVAGQIVP